MIPLFYGLPEIEAIRLGAEEHEAVCLWRRAQSERATCNIPAPLPNVLRPAGLGAETANTQRCGRLRVAQHANNVYK